MNITDSQPMLRIEAIDTYYGKSHIIQGLSLEVNANECVALLGRNGAGKTTTLRSIIGLTPPRRGGIFLAQKPISGLKPYQIALRGVAYVPENRQIFSTLTVLENLQLSVQRDRGKGIWSLERVFELFPRLAERRTNRGNQLSGGEQQMLAIARALMANPDLILLDEPTEGLAPLIVETLLETIAGIKQEGLTIILVEQNVAATRAVADRYYILQQGKCVYRGDHDNFWAEPDLQTRYLGV